MKELTLPVTELQVGDEVWQDGELLYRLEAGPLPHNEGRNWIVFRIQWANGSSGHREWTRQRTLTIRRK